MYYITSVPSCYEHLLSNILERISSSEEAVSGSFKTEEHEGNIRVLFVPTKDGTYEEIQKTIVPAGTFIDGFIAGCEYTAANSIQAPRKIS